MGYCYQGKKLCCDICGFAGARKMRCPFGYCQATAVCANCRKAKKHPNKAWHVSFGCQKNHEAFVATETKRKQLLNDGEALLMAAFGHDNICQVMFEAIRGHIVVYMPTAVYSNNPTIGNGRLATLKDYQALWPVTFPSACANFYAEQAKEINDARNILFDGISASENK